MSDTSRTSPFALEKSGSAVVVRVTLKMLDDKELKVLGQIIDQTSVEPGVEIVVIDLSKVQILPSLGLGLLVQMSVKCKTRNQKLRLAALAPQLRDVLRITKLDRVLDLCDTVEEASQ